MGGKISAHGIYGYPDQPRGLEEVAVAMLATRHGWTIAPESLCWLPSLVAGLELCCRAFAGPGRRVLTTTPIYPPFLHAPVHQGATCVRWPLVRDAGRWVHDLDALRGHLRAGIDVVLLCSPHNPTGRCFSRAELAALAAVLADSDAIIIADEAWADLVFAGPFTPFAVAAPELAARTVTLISPAKSFNLPGLRVGAAVVEDAALRQRLESVGHGILGEQNVLGLVAAEAAWRDGWDWHAQTLAQLRRNRDHAHAQLAGGHGLSGDLPEATYLLWLDAAGLGVKDPAAWFEQRGIGVMPGAWFGAPQHVRLNLAMAPELLDRAIARIRG